MSPHVITWIVAALATAGVIMRPFNLPEAIWAVAGAALLIVTRLLSPSDALTGVAKGSDVYLFLFGMMLLAEIAREEGLFAWLAAVATSHAKGSARRLFLLTYGGRLSLLLGLSGRGRIFEQRRCLAASPPCRYGR